LLKVSLHFEVMMEVIEKFHEVVSHRHEYAEQWKGEKGRPVLGCFCDYVPEEVIYAAGILPVRILGGHEPQSIADVHISPNKWCPFCRHCLAQGLAGKYHYLGGIVTTLSCFHLQQSFDSWQKHVPVAYSYFLDMPFYVQGHLAHECFTREIEQFVSSLEKWTGRPVSQSALKEAIKTYNKDRQLMRRVYQQRKFANPRVSGVEAMEMVLASMLMDKEEHSHLLEQMLEKVAHDTSGAVSGIRLMVIGAESEDTETVRLIESLGANVVVDAHFIGTRYFWNDVSLDGNPIRSIAARYLEKPPYPQEDFPKSLGVAHAVRLAKDFDVQGAIMLLNTYCDPFQWEIPLLSRQFEENSIPLMVLDLNPIKPDAQMRNRLEAFIEMLGQ
jgi:benzoyl-CoA reductase subunit C